jgi:multidrug efflux pump subunit AcrA (membrane-fusion protein)
MMSDRTGWTWAAALALAAPLAGCGLHGKPRIERKAGASVAPAALAVAARSAASKPVSPAVPEPDAVVSPGIVEPWGGEADLSAQEPGWMAQIAVKEGEVVQAGQLLATLEDGAQRRSVDLARADLAEAEAALARIENGATPEELRQAEADGAAAAARGSLARSAAARTTRLHAQGAVPDSEVERATAESQAATALAERAEARLQELKRGRTGRSAARAWLPRRSAPRLASNLARRRIQ